MGINGATFDYTFFNGGPYSTYAQWSGWRRVLATLRSTHPGFIIDNRQQNHEWGMWVRFCVYWRQGGMGRGERDNVFVCV